MALYRQVSIADMILTLRTVTDPSIALSPCGANTAGIRRDFAYRTAPAGVSASLVT